MTDEIDYIYRNHILIMDDTFSEEQCRDTIEYFERSRKAGLGWDASSRHRKDGQLAVSETLHLYGPELFGPYLDMFWNSVYTTYIELAPHLRSLGEQGVHWLKVQKTPIGGGFHDFHSEQGGNKANFCRILAFMTYLNDVEGGGETEFLDQNMRVSAKRGRTVLWPAYFTHPHRGNPPLSNEKYIITGWVEL